MKEIIKLYPNQLSSKSIKDGGTPLHWAKSKEIIEALLEANTHINAKNFKGDTALHTMVRNERVDCVLALISQGRAVYWAGTAIAFLTWMRSNYVVAICSD